MAFKFPVGLWQEDGEPQRTRRIDKLFIFCPGKREARRSWVGFPTWGLTVWRLDVLPVAVWVLRVLQVPPTVQKHECELKAPSVSFNL